MNGIPSEVSWDDRTRNGVSIDACAYHCKKKNFKFFGMENGGTCRCSHTYGSKGEDPYGCKINCLQGTNDNSTKF